MNSSEEVLWMLLTILSLPVDIGVSYICKDATINKYSDNMDHCFIKFTSALNTYEYSWVDEFDFLYDSVKLEYSNIQLSFSESLNNLREEDMNLIEYNSGKNWACVRDNGKKILRLSGLPLYEPMAAIEYCSLLEFVYNNDGNLIAFN